MKIIKHKKNLSVIYDAQHAEKSFCNHISSIIYILHELIILIYKDTNGKIHY